MCTGLEALFAGGLGGAGAGGFSLGTALSILSTGFKVISALGQGNAAQDQANYNAQVENNNAIAARQQASFDERRLRKQILLSEGSNRNRASAAGGDLLDMGDVFDDNSSESEVDALAIRYGGETRARASEQRATLAQMEGRLAKRKAFTSAGSSLITGFAKAVA